MQAATHLDRVLFCCEIHAGRIGPLGVRLLEEGNPLKARDEGRKLSPSVQIRLVPQPKPGNDSSLAYKLQNQSHHEAGFQSQVREAHSHPAPER